MRHHAGETIFPASIQYLLYLFPIHRYVFRVNNFDYKSKVFYTTQYFKAIEITKLSKKTSTVLVYQ